MVSVCLPSGSSGKLLSVNIGKLEARVVPTVVEVIEAGVWGSSI